MASDTGTLQACMAEDMDMVTSGEALLMRCQKSLPKYELLAIRARSFLSRFHHFMQACLSEQAARAT